MDSGHIVIVGAGQAGTQTAESLRSGGFTGAITMLGDEPHGPYHRPPLSKAWLAGDIGEAQLVMRAPEMLAKKGITLRTGMKVGLTMDSWWICLLPPAWFAGLDDAVAGGRSYGSWILAGVALVATMVARERIN